MPSIPDPRAEDRLLVASLVAARRRERREDYVEQARLEGQIEANRLLDHDAKGAPTGALTRAVFTVVPAVLLALFTLLMVGGVIGTLAWVLIILGRMFV